jgi:hypothetical protein
VLIVDSNTFKVSKTIAAAIVTLHPGDCTNSTGIRMRMNGGTTSAEKAG